MKTLSDHIHHNEILLLHKELIRRLGKSEHGNHVKKISIGMSETAIIINLDNGNQPIPNETQQYVIGEMRTFLTARKQLNKIATCVYVRRSCSFKTAKISGNHIY